MSIEEGRLAGTTSVSGHLTALLAPPDSAPELITHQNSRTARWHLKD